ncbi:hypothetical protein [Saccharothrix violaceirubra]|uniref:Uncharacterized protein n=1 Tax=Saccharothrix violaceirubra TaxID=413306 RepID=A0A7W7T9K4_9PSEU|nr:hypothetical protein [Saccharothrix violaceirubra]MBB4969025.1 hypothetical protein [Saccharothrix violaceirubra]
MLSDSPREYQPPTEATRPSVRVVSFGYLHVHLPRVLTEGGERG